MGVVAAAIFEQYIAPGLTWVEATQTCEPGETVCTNRAADCTWEQT